MLIIRGEENGSNKIFSLFILSISLWSFGLLLFRLTDSLDLALSYTRFYYVAAAAIPTFFLHFSYIFPTKKPLTIYKRVLLYLPLSVITIGLIVNPHFILNSVYFIDESTKSAKINTINYVAYTIYFISFLAIAYTNLSRAFLSTKDKSIRAQLKFIFVGTIIPYIIAMYFDLISPPFDYTHVWVGPIMAIVVVWALLFAVYRHHLLNVKVITTELFVASLWIFILIKTLISTTDQDKFINAGLLMLTIVVGILLIISVSKEVRQREKIQILANNLEQANARLTEHDKQKSEFVSFASHQLRAPLTAMKGYGSLLLEGEMGKLEPKTKEGIQRIYDSATTLVNIVDDYLNVSRIELGTMRYNFETVSLKSLVEDVIAELKPSIDKSGLKLTFSVEDNNLDYHTTADRDKLKQVVMNLIDNSMKYTPTGSVVVSLSFDRAKHRFVFMVKDTGIGIAPEILPYLFQKFSRAANASKTNIKGTGLGLYVARQVVESHQGAIRAESAGEGKGATFVVELEPFGKV